MPPMRDLLEKWAALEPERCLTVDDSDHAFVTVENSPIGAWLPGVVLAATIEAIEAQRTSRDRGWTWTLSSPRNDEPRHRALVYHADKKWKGGRGDTPAEALLTAYLAALEAEAERARQAEEARP